MSSENIKNVKELSLPCISTQEIQKNNENRPLNSSGNDNNSDISLNIEDGGNKLKSTGDFIYTFFSKSSDVVSFAHLNPEDVLRENTLSELMKKMLSKHYTVSETEYQDLLIHEKCKLLFEKDYICKMVDNCNYCPNYPIRIIVPVGKKTDTEGSTINFDDIQYSKLVMEGHEARRNCRFVAPAILFDRKFICRSGTLSVKLSKLREMAAKAVSPRTTYNDEDAFSILTECNLSSTCFAIDAETVKHLKIEHIMDLNTVYSLICKKTMSLVSTEKLHEDLYKGVKLEDMPYFGSTYFSVYHRSGRKTKGLSIAWQEADTKRPLKLTEDLKPFFPEIDFDSSWENWNMTELTRNYLKIMLSYLVTGTGGIAMHCKSGWDRTPLFVTLLRLSLWADGVIHEHLEFRDIAYLTLAYDWYLFGHKLPIRLGQTEEVMHFCFNVLEHITSDEFSVTRMFQELPAQKKRNRVFPEFVPGRRIVLNKIRDLVLEAYDEEIIQKKFV